MNKDDLIRDVKLILFHFKKWVEENDHWDLFQNLPDDIFSGPQRDQIKDLLYNIYAFDFDYLKKVNNAVDQVPVVSLDRDLKAYKEASNLAKQSCFDSNRLGKCSDCFVDSGGWFWGSSPVRLDRSIMTLRVYVNVKIEWLPQFVSDVLESMEYFTSKQIFFRFKFVDPKFANMDDLLRPEKIVFYLVETGDLSEFKVFLEKRKHYFRRDVPKFTSKIMNGVAFGPNAGLDAEKHYGTNSFGEIVSIILSERLLSFYVGNGRLPNPNEFEMFGISTWKALYG